MARSSTVGASFAAIGIALLVVSTAAGMSAGQPNHSFRRPPREVLRPAVVAPASAASPSLSGWWKVPVKGPAPSNRTEAQMAWDSEDGEVLLEGGCVGYAEFGCGSPLSDVWAYSNGSWTNLTPAGAPTGRDGGVMADDPNDGYVVLFGGDGRSGVLNDTWTYSAGSWNNITRSPSPPPLRSAAMAYDPALAGLVLAGGELGGGAVDSNYTWLFHGGAWTNISAPTHPPGWVSPFLASQSATGGVIEYGGITALFFPTYDQQSWTLSGRAWSPSPGSASLPGSRLGAQGGFAPAWNETLLFGGGGGTSIYRDLWAYTPVGSWTQLGNLHLPSGAFYATQSAWDGADGCFVSFSQVGVGSFYGFPTISGVFNSTWILTTTIGLNLSAPSAGVLAGTTANFSVVASGGEAPYTVNWTFGDGTGRNGTSAVGHSYARPGSYNVSVNVTDSVGQSVTRTFVVNATAPAPSSGLLGGSGSAVWLAVGIGAVVVVAAVVVVVLWRRPRRARPSPDPGAPAVDGPPTTPPPEA